MASPSRFVNEAQAALKDMIRKLYEVENQARITAEKYARLGSNGFTNNHFYALDSNGDHRWTDTAGAEVLKQPDGSFKYADETPYTGDTFYMERDDTEYTAAEFSTAIGNLGQLQAIITNANMRPYVETFLKVTG